VKRIDKSWKTACKKDGAGIKAFHNFRRTLVRNALRAITSGGAAMRTSGHTTGVVFELTIL
jgi:hypothetical protein